MGGGGAVPQTPLQRSAYLDTCTSWLTSEPSLGDHQIASTQFSEGTTTTLRFEASAESRELCVLCRQHPSSVPVIANPFTQCFRIYVCTSCNDRLE